jgi:hypothetical protein
MRKRGYIYEGRYTYTSSQTGAGGGTGGGLNIKLTCGLFLKLKRVPSLKL